MIPCLLIQASMAGPPPGVGYGLVAGPRSHRLGFRFFGV